MAGIVADPWRFARRLPKRPVSRATGALESRWESRPAAAVDGAARGFRDRRGSRPPPPLLLMNGVQAGEDSPPALERSHARPFALTDTKTGPRHVLLGESARALLDGLAESASGEWVFPGGKGNGPLSTDDLWKFWIKARDGAGVVADARLHDLRRACAA